MKRDKLQRKAFEAGEDAFSKDMIRRIDKDEIGYSLFNSLPELTDKRIKVGKAWYKGYDTALCNSMIEDLS